jgi:hypothetical protein
VNNPQAHRTFRLAIEQIEVGADSYKFTAGGAELFLVTGSEPVAPRMKCNKRTQLSDAVVICPTTFLSLDWRWSSP